MEDYLSESICRTCLQSSDELTSLHLKDDDTGLTLLDKLRFCASMQVPVSERTPSNACAPCVRCITDYYDFKRRCEQSEQTLEELCAEYNVPKLEVFIEEEEDDGDISKVAAKTDPEDSTSMCDYDFKRRCEQSEQTLEELCAEYNVPKVEFFFKKEEGDGDISKIAAKTDLEDSTSMCDNGSDWTNISEEVDGGTIVSENWPSCDLCKITFCDQSSLRHHLRLHTVEQLKSPIDPTADVLKESSNSDVTQRDSEDKKWSPDQLDSLKNPCDMCLRTFPTIKHLKRHMETHKKGSKFVCDTCGKAFRGVKLLRIHMTESHGAEKPIYECNVCGKTYNFISNLIAHKRTHNRQKRTPKAPDVGVKRQCDGCEEVFNSLPELREHKASAHPDLDPHIVKVPANRPSCDLCQKTFCDRTRLRRHLRLHAPKQATSPVDSKTDASNRMESANSDSALHENEVKFLTPGQVDNLKGKHSCDQCPRSFATIRYLRRHKSNCHSDRRHQCDQCGSSFAHAYYLRRHLKSHVPGVKNKFICETCGKEYSLEESLRRHIVEKHSAEKPIYTCKVCGKTYNCKGSIDSHKRTHKDVKDRFRCDRCDSAFPTRARLMRHVKLSHDKLYSCDMCDKHFAIEVNLLKHKAYHAIEMAKPYACTLCKKRFSTTSAVSVHVSTLHNSKNHLKCDVCGMEFYHRSHYTAHYSSHTGIKPYRCDGCGLGYRYNKSLMEHQKKCASLLELARQ